MIVPRPNRQVVSDADTDALWTSTNQTDLFLQRLRELGAYKIESITALRRVTGLSLGKAKETVHFSPAWADKRASDDAFHDSLFEAAEQIMQKDQALERIAS